MQIKYMFRITGTTIFLFGETKKDLIKYAKRIYPHLKSKWQITKCEKSS